MLCVATDVVCQLCNHALSQLSCLSYAELNMAVSNVATASIENILIILQLHIQLYSYNVYDDKVHCVGCL